MIKRLQRKFVLIAMGSLFIILVAVVGSINIYNVYHMNNIADGVLELLAENSGRFPEFSQEQQDQNSRLAFQITAETSYETRYFTVRISDEGTVTEVDTSNIAAVTPEQAEDFAMEVLNSMNATGYVDVYKYLVVEEDDGISVIFLDRFLQMQTVQSFFWISFSIATLSFVIMFVLVSLLSKRAIKPVAESIEKQKQFITDASHEIKTPLAIISANTEVLELTTGNNQWTESIRNQTNRLDNLVKSLLTLSKMEEEKVQLVFEEFSISNLVQETASSFEVLAERQGKHFEVNIQPDLNLKANESSVRQVISILLDNAVKYTYDGGEISVSLRKQGKATLIEVCNTSDALPEGDLNRLFDRFFRADSSRSRESGSYGIGLSIAKAIVQAHNGKISVRHEKDNLICFSVTFT